MKRTKALAIVGRLSRTSKMPGYSYGLSAEDCHTGGILKKQEGTPCSLCYASKGRYRGGRVQKAHRRRLKTLYHPKWVEAMVYLISHVKDPRKRACFRWHDSGDIQSLQHLINITEVARLTPDIYHYLPTQERSFVRQYVQLLGIFPKNLVVRISSVHIDSSYVYPIVNTQTSSIHDKLKPLGYACPAREKYNNTCGPCRACWDKSVPNVSYPLH